MTHLAPTSHHPEGPSQWPIFAECADFESPAEDLENLDVAALLPEEERGREDAKQLGTRLHRALAAVLTRQPDPLAGLNDRQREQVQWVAEQVLEIAARHGYAPEEIKVEVRLTMFVGESFEILYFGTCDIQIGPAIVIDAKFGDMRNYFPQLVGYLLPLMAEYGFRRGYAYTVYGRWQRVQQYVVDLETAETVGYGILSKRKDPDRKPTPCQYCGWCAKSASCVAFTRPVVALVNRREDWLLKLQSVHVSSIGSDPVQAGLARWIWKYHLEPWGAAVEFLTASMSERGLTPLGFQRQPQKGSRFVPDGKAAAGMRALVKAGVPIEAIEPFLDVTFSKLVLAYRKSMNVSEAKAEKAVEEILSGAGAFGRAEASTKLIKAKDGADLLRLAMAQKVLPADLTPGSPSPHGDVAP